MSDREETYWRKRCERLERRVEELIAEIARLKGPVIVPEAQRIIDEARRTG